MSDLNLERARWRPDAVGVVASMASSRDPRAAAPPTRPSESLRRHLAIVVSSRRRQDWKEAARFFAEVSKCSRSSRRTRSETTRRWSTVLGAIRLWLESPEKKAHYDKVQAMIKRHKANTVLKDRIAGSAEVKCSSSYAGSNAHVYLAEISFITEANARL